MPKVPIYESRVGTKPLEAAKVGPGGVSLDPIAKGVGAISEAIGDVSREVEKARDEARATDAWEHEIAIRKEEERLWSNDSDKDEERGYRYRIGKDAVERGGEVSERLKTWADERLATIADPETRKVVERMYAGRRLAFDTKVETHAGEQRDVAARVTFESMLATRMDDVLDRGLDPTEQIEASMGDFRKIARTDEEVNAKRREIESRIYTGLAEKHIKARDGASLKAFVGKHGNKLAPGLREGINREIRNIDDEREADAFVAKIGTDEAYAYKPPNKGEFSTIVPKKWVDEAAARKAFNEELAKPGLSDHKRKALESRMSDFLRQSEEARNAEISDRQTAMLGAASKGWRSFVDSEDSKWMREHATRLWEAVNEDFQRKADRADVRRARRANGKEPANQDELAKLVYDSIPLAERASMTPAEAMKRVHETITSDYKIANPAFSPEGVAAIIASRTKDGDAFTKLTENGYRDFKGIAKSKIATEKMSTAAKEKFDSKVDAFARTWVETADPKDVLDRGKMSDFIEENMMKTREVPDTFFIFDTTRTAPRWEVDSPPSAARPAEPASPSVPPAAPAAAADSDLDAKVRVMLEQNPAMTLEEVEAALVAEEN